MKKFLKIAFAIIFCSILSLLYSCQKVNPPTDGLGGMYVEFTLPPPSISSCSYNTPLNEIGNSSDKWKVEITIHGTTTEGKGWIIEKKYSDITLTSSPRGFRAFAIAGIPLHSGELTISVALVSDCQTATPTHSCNSNNNWRVEFFGSKIIPTPSVGIDLNNNVTIHIGNISITGHKAGC